MHMEPSDAAKRMCEAVTLATLAGGTGRWMAFRLASGTTDHAQFDNRSQAVAHCTFPALFCFLQIAPNGMQPKEAEAVLGYWRQLYDAGGRFNDAELEMPLIPLTGADRQRQIHTLVKGK
jgi:hypothetical protein